MSLNGGEGIPRKNYLRGREDFSRVGSAFQQPRYKETGGDSRALPVCLCSLLVNASAFMLLPSLPPFTGIGTQFL